MGLFLLADGCIRKKTAILWQYGKDVLSLRLIQ
jgi:hypothetical protein